MVQLTAALCKYIPSWYAINNSSSKRFWKKHNLFKISQYYYGRGRNCHKIAMKKFHKYTQYEGERERGRVEKLRWRDFYSQRILAACMEHDFPYEYFISSLPQMGVELDRKSLASLAIWEPRTFKSLVELAKEFSHKNPISPLSKGEKPQSVISRGNLDNLVIKII